MKIAQLQMMVPADKQESLDQLRRELDKVMAASPDMVALGEMFACPYYTPNFPIYAEERGGMMWQALSDIAREYGVYLSAGSVPELEDGNVYNTAYVFDRAGNEIAAHRKVHLFDIDIKGGQSFKESDTLSAGDRHTVFETEFGTMGICVCFDCRFPELARLMVLDGAKAILVPAAFNMTTGPAHWEVMYRSRAVDNQCYMIATSPARDPGFSYVAWGHSMIVDPWGKVISELGDAPAAAVTEIDFGYVDQIREQLPLLSARRTDLYDLTDLYELSV